MTARTSPLKVRVRRGTAREWDVHEKAALHLWLHTWGGRILPMPKRDCFDAFWTDGKVLIGALEVKLHTGLPGQVDDPEVLSMPVTKWSMAVWFEHFRITPFVIFVMPDRVLWQHALEVHRFGVWTPREDVTNQGGKSVPEVIVSYRVADMHLLDNQPLFTERSPGGTHYAVPS
jgi:hypothetical protein